MRPEQTVISILDFTPDAHRTMEQFLIGLNAQMRSKGWRTVYVFSGIPGEEFAEQLKLLESPYLIANFPLSWRDVPKLANDLRRYRPSAVQICFMSPFNLALWRLKKTLGARHFVFADHSSGAASNKGQLKRLLARFRGAAAGRYIDQVVAVSDFNRRRDIEQSYLPADKSRTIYNGIDSDKFNLEERPPNRDSTTIGFVGQLIPEKGVHLLLKAVKELIEEEKDLNIRVKIAGQGHQAGELKRYCRDHGLDQVEFLGQINWVPRLFAQSDIAVVPSVWEEAFGFTVAEAMACRACVVASDAGGIPEVVGPGGEAGLIFRKGDVPELKKHLRDLIADPARRERMGRKARERVVEKFSIRRMIGQYADLFDELAVGHRAVVKSGNA